MKIFTSITGYSVNVAIFAKLLQAIGSIQVHTKQDKTHGTRYKTGRGRY